MDRIDEHDDDGAIDIGSFFRRTRVGAEDVDEDTVPGSDVVIARQVAAFVVFMVVCIAAAIALAARMDWHGFVREMLKWMHAGQ